MKEVAVTGDFIDKRTPELRNQMVERHLNLAHMVAHRFVNRGVEYDDLYQVAAMALVKAVDRFDDARGNTFASFAIPTIVGEVKNYFRDRTHLVRVPRRSVEMVTALEKIRTELTQILKRSPTVPELAEALNVPLDVVLEVAEVRNALRPAYLDAVDGEGSENEDKRNLYDMLGVDEDGYEHFELRDLMEQALKELPEMERRVLYERYYLNQSQRAIADRLNTSQMTISRTERRAIEKMRKHLKM